MTRSELSSLDLATLTAAESVVVDAIRSMSCQWEQESADAATEGNLSAALVYKQWADASDIVIITVLTEFSKFFGEAVRARLGGNDSRSAQDQLLDALALEVASAQPEPLVMC